MTKIPSPTLSVKWADGLTAEDDNEAYYSGNTSPLTIFFNYLVFELGCLLSPCSSFMCILGGLSGQNLWCCSFPPSMQGRAPAVFFLKKILHSLVPTHFQITSLHGFDSDR